MVLGFQRGIKAQFESVAGCVWINRQGYLASAWALDHQLAGRYRLE